MASGVDLGGVGLEREDFGVSWIESGSAADWGGGKSHGLILFPQLRNGENSNGSRGAPVSGTSLSCRVFTHVVLSSNLCDVGARNASTIVGNKGTDGRRERRNGSGVAEQSML